MALHCGFQTPRSNWRAEQITPCPARHTGRAFHIDANVIVPSAVQQHGGAGFQLNNAATERQ